jgi:serine/threonine-protein kinase
MHIDHPNVVKIRSVGEADGRPFIAMEALRGEPLGDYLRREGAMAIDLALPLFRAAMQGLAAAHAEGVIHRDVKPDNLFLLGDPGTPEALKVIDFGMAKTRDDNDPQHGLVMGTVEYMSPEQVLTDPVDARTDIYSLGVVMFRALTGHLPFDVDLGVDLVAHQIFSPAPPISWLAEMVDPRLESLILTAMRKHPDNRYQSMDALLSDLDRILGRTSGEPEGAPLRKVPDAYQPRTSTAREAATAISARVGLTPRSA